MAPTRRKARFLVEIDGIPLLSALSARANYGLDQEMATADVIAPWPLPSFVNKFSRIVVTAGFLNYTERFTGYVLGFNENLWPGRETLRCGDVMSLLDGYYPLSDIDFSGLTDQQIVTLVLNTVGIPEQMQDISGTGKVVAAASTIATTWPVFQSALEVIKEIDSMSLGYRTFADPSGVIHRVFINTTPGESNAFNFEEGLNVLSGTMDFASVDPKNEITAVGDGVLTVSTNLDNFNWRSNPWWQRYAMLQQQATSMGFLSTQEVSEWLLGELNRNLIKGSFATFVEDDLIFPMSIGVNSPRWRVNQNFWLQSVSIEMNNNGVFRQNIGVVSEITNESTLAPGIQTPVNLPLLGLKPGAKLTPLAPRTPIAPSLNDIRVAFTVVAIDQETVLVSGVPTIVYVITCSDNSTSFQGTIASRAWEATGGGAIIDTGTGKTFTTAFLDLATASIELEVTDSNGNTKSLIKTPLNNIGASIRSRKLYAITDAVFEAFDGTSWRSYAPSSGSPTALANGPEAAAGDINITTADDLATAGVETTPVPGDTITSIWAELDASSVKRVLGFASGAVGISVDSGSTITLVTSPPGTTIRRVILSRYVPGQIHVVTDTGYYVSDNNGSGWRVIVAGDFSDLILSFGRNVLVTTAGALVLAAPVLTPFTFSPSASVVCATSHIRQDKFYALDTLGRAWHQGSEADGSFVMVLGQSIPSGSPQVRGMYRHGTIVDKVYFAAGSGGLWETIDGFRTADGYLQLRV